MMQKILLIYIGTYLFVCKSFSDKVWAPYIQYAFMDALCYVHVMLCGVTPWNFSDSYIPADIILKIQHTLRCYSVFSPNATQHST